MTFEEMLADYRKGLEWREDYDDFMDSLDGRGGICAPDAAAEYADELNADDIPIGELGLTQVHGDPLLAMPSARVLALRAGPVSAVPAVPASPAIARKRA